MKGSETEGEERGGDYFIFDEEARSFLPPLASSSKMKAVGSFFIEDEGRRKLLHRNYDEEASNQKAPSDYSLLHRNSDEGPP